MTKRRCIDCHRTVRKVVVTIRSSTGVDLGTFGEKCGRKAAATYNKVGLNVTRTVTRPYVAEGIGRVGGADLAEIRCVPGIVRGHVGCDHDPDRMDAAPNPTEVDRG